MSFVRFNVIAFVKKINNVHIAFIIVHFQMKALYQSLKFFA